MSLTGPFNNLDASSTVANTQAGQPAVAGPTPSATGGPTPSNPSGYTGPKDSISTSQLNAQTGLPTGATATPTVMTQGWYITIGIVVAMIFGNVPVLGPILFGVLGLALLYQISQLLQGQ